MKFNNIIFKGAIVGALVMASSCSEDFLETQPSQFLDGEDVSASMQEDPSKVQSYVTGAYMNLYDGGEQRQSHDDFGLPAIKIFTDLLCEDVAYHRDAHFFCFDYQLDNRLGNYRRTVSTWRQLYQVVDNANTIIELLKPADGEQPEGDVKKMLGQAYALRAYSYFWLVNLWQQPLSAGADQLGVPLKTETEYRPERVPVGEIYEQILSDIDTGYKYLEGEGYISGKSNISEYAAAFIYANVLMFTGDYDKAAQYAEKAIAGGQLNNEEQMLSGFNSLDLPEVIWGYSVTSETTGYYASFFSHVDSYFIGYGGQVGFRKLVSSYLYDQIDDSDVRKLWFGETAAYNLLKIDFSYEESYGFDEYISNKFRDKYMTTYGEAEPFTSDIIYFRTAEMYYVAAEAYYLAGQVNKAQDMLNTIMATRVPGYNCGKTGQALLDEICIQKRIEMFLEGCRYLDAKRRNEMIERGKSTDYAADLNNYNAINYSSRDYRMIYRIPTVEMQNNPSIPPSDDNK